jgi:DNA modification methylase
VRCDSTFRLARLASRWVVAFCQIEAVAAWRASFETGGLQWVRGGVWRKPDGAPQFTGDRPGQGFECLAIAHPFGRKRWNGGGKHAVWTFGLEHAHGKSGKNEHATTKPSRLMLALVSDFTDPGETILDPFAGSGTIGVACLRLGRRFIGIEKDPRYFALACERLRAEESGSTLQAARAGQMPLLGGVK